MAAAARTVTDGLREVTLADASRTDEQNVLAFSHEGTCRQVDDLRLRNARIEREVEVLERALMLEVRAV